MAGSSENIAVSDVTAENDDVKYGFKRPEMYESKLAGTATVYDRHVFLCYKSYMTWPSRVEASDSDPLPKRFAGALKARKDDIKLKTMLTICEAREDIGLSDGDVLIFPEMIKYRDLKESDVDAFVEEVLVNGKPWGSGLQEPLSGSYVFVCAHNNRDRRCGVCGPVLIEEFSKVIESKGLKSEVYVTACSHIGGHKYAGNVIIFSADKEGKIAGHWYGYVTPEDVAILLDEHIREGKVIERLWRGQMGLPAEITENGHITGNGPVRNGIIGDEKEKTPAEITDNGQVPNGTKVDEKEKTPLETANEENKDAAMSCCQGAAGFSCCRDVSAEAKDEEKGHGKLSKWLGKWDKPEVLTAIGVVGAAAFVAVAYGFYRKSQ